MEKFPKDRAWLPKWGDKNGHARKNPPYGVLVGGDTDSLRTTNNMERDAKLQ